MANDHSATVGGSTSGPANRAGAIRPESGPTHSARSWNALLDLLPVGVFTVGPDQRIRSINGEAARLTGVDARAALGRSCEDVLHCAFCSPACATKEARRCDETRRDFPVELRRGDGTPMSVLIDAAPLDDGEVAVTLRDVTDAERMRRTLRERWAFHGIVGMSSAMKDVVSQIRDAAPTDSTVLILGERGTGKELVARAIHAESPRAGAVFVRVDASALSETLLEAELFGHAAGTGPGAARERAGRFELADGGTLYIDGVGELSPRLQERLLRAIRDKRVERVGAHEPRAVDVRVVAGTHRDLLREVREGRFRDDLLKLLNPFTLRLPPLRERKEDLPALVDHLLRRACLRAGRAAPVIADDAMEALLTHGWPGNVRELEQAIETAVEKCREGAIHAADLPAVVSGRTPEETPGHAERLRAALHRSAGSVTLAARLLGVHRTTLWRWMAEEGVRREDFLPEWDTPSP